MANAKKCDRCGKLFEPYNIDAGYKVPNRYMNILLRNVLLVDETYKELGDYDLCKECNDSLLKWLNLAKDKTENKKRCFGKYDGDVDCLMCLQDHECKVVTEIMNSWCFGNNYGKLNNQCQDCICKNECKISFDRKRIKEVSSSGK